MVRPLAHRPPPKAQGPREIFYRIAVSCQILAGSRPSNQSADKSARGVALTLLIFFKLPGQLSIAQRMDSFRLAKSPAVGLR